MRYRELGRRMDAVIAPLKRAVMVGEGKWFAVDLLGMGLTWILVVVSLSENASIDLRAFTSVLHRPA